MTWLQFAASITLKQSLAVAFLIWLFFKAKFNDTYEFNLGLILGAFIAMAAYELSKLTVPLLVLLGVLN